MGPLVQSLRDSIAQVTVICGHYGVGKTNFSVNLACDLADMGKHVTLVDLDIVNPYFRASEQRKLLEAHGITLIAPVFAEAGSSLDVPSLRGSITSAVQDAWRKADECRVVLIDAGGDDVGATALGRFSDVVKLGDYAMLYLVNASRFDTQQSSEAVEMLSQIQNACDLKATGIVDNAHLKDETSIDLLCDAFDLASQVSQITQLPLVCKTAKRELASDLQRALDDRIEHTKEGAGPDAPSRDFVYPVSIYVKNPWE